MKHLLLLLPLLLLAACKPAEPPKPTPKQVSDVLPRQIGEIQDDLNRMTDADAACSSWADKGGRILRALSADEEPYTTFIRDCEYEEATRQFLGYDIPGAQVGATYIGDGSGTYTNENGHVLGRQVITKRFKY